MVRNKMKRRFRALIAENYSLLPSGYLYVFIAKRSLPLLSFEAMRTDFSDLLRTIRRELNT